MPILICSLSNIYISQQKQKQIDSDDYMEVDDEDSDPGLQSKTRKSKPPVQVQYSKYLATTL
jgi:hypothetical protein